MDWPEVARRITEGSRGGRALVLLDRYAESAGYYLHGPGTAVEMVYGGGEGFDRARQMLRDRDLAVAWHVRQSREWTGGPGERLDAELASEWELRRHPLVPYSSLDRRVLGWMARAGRPTHVLEIVEMRPRRRR